MKKLIISIFILLCIILYSCGETEEELSSVSSCYGISDISQNAQISEPASSESSAGESRTESEDISANEESSEEPPEESSNEESTEIIEKSYNNFVYSGFEEEQIKELTKNLLKIIDTAPFNISIYVKDLTTVNAIGYESDVKYRSASVIKAPYVYYLLNSNKNLDQKCEMKSNHKQDGSGILKNQTVGTLYTVKQLIEYSLLYSDNTAYYMLYEMFGFDEFNAYCKTLGIETKTSIYDYLGYMSAMESVMFMEDIHNMIISDDPKGDILYDSMISATYKTLIPSGIKNKPIAHKFGMMTGVTTVLHDAGIIYGENPYIISIFTNCNNAVNNGASVFVEISSLIDKFMSEFYE